MKEALARNRYALAPGLLSPEMAAICARYATAQRRHAFQGGDPQAPHSHSVWGDFLTESLLESLQPKIEALAGLTLLPTYSFYRVYVPNEQLLPHKDRPSCEVSCTLCLGYDYRGKDYRWRIHMGDARLAMAPGDAVIYLGCEVEHWREPLLVPAGGWHAQAFLHYVRSEGPHAAHRFDGRPSLYAARVR
jgi:hypothetical protein